MNKIKHLIISVFLIVLLALLTFAQTSQPNPTGNKIVIVDTSAFFVEKTGVTKILAASKQFEAELAPKRNELEQIVNRIQTLEKDIQNLQESVAKKIPIDEKSAQAKVDELERLKREGKFKEEEYNKFAKKRQNELVGPPFSEAMIALSDYIKAKGFGIVFDVSKDQGGMLIYATEQFDITKDFIATYNSRPATTAPKTPAKP